MAVGTKISEMDLASEVGNGDLLAILQAGDNFAATRDQLLTAGTAEDINVDGSAGQDARLRNFGASAIFEADNGGNCNITFSNGCLLQLAGVVNAFSCDSIGNVIVECDTNRSVVIGDPAACLLTMNGFGGNCTITGTNPHSISFNNPGSGDWATSDPADYQIAFNRLAALVRTLNGGTPIP